jgi:hypothetical protein
MTYKEIDSNSDIDLVKQFCLAQKRDNNFAIDNIDIEDWENKTHTLLYLIFIEKRFDTPNAKYFITEDLQAGMGFYPADFDENICTVSRFYTNLQVKGLGKDIGHHLFYYALEQAEELGYKGFIYTFNDYNELLREKIFRVNSPDNYKNYACMAEKKNDVWIKYHYREPNIRITPLTKFGPITYRNIKQWCLYHLWDETHEQALVEKIGHLGG